MRNWALCIGSLATLCTLAPCQTTADSRKLHALGDGLAKDIERQAERINDPAITEYLQRIENRLALAGGVKTLELRLTRNSKPNAVALPNEVLYISSSLLERVENEAELAGLLAHETAHLPWQPFPLKQVAGPLQLFVPPCILSSPPQALLPVGWIKDQRAREQQATAQAVNTLRAAGYDPEAVLTLLSKLSYEHPAWGKAIVSDDLLDLRVTLENDVPPTNGYLMDGSQFLQMKARLAR